MKRLLLLGAGVLLGALAVTGQEAREDALVREIEQMKALLRERIAKGPAQADGAVVPRTYDVADLTARFYDRPQPLTYLPPNADEEPPEVLPRRFLEIDQLVELVKCYVEPASWEAEGANLEPRDGQLFARTFPRVHGKIDRTLAWLRSCADRRVTVEVAVVPVNEADAALLSGALELTADESQRLQAPLGAITLTGFDGQLLGGRAGREITYVQDYDIDAAEDGKTWIGDPVAARLFAGCTAEVRACLDEGQGAILQCQLQLSRVTEPLPVHATGDGNIELPTKQVTRIQASFWAPLGRTVIAGGCTVGEEPCVILVTVRRK